MKTIKCELCGKKEKDRDANNFECIILQLLGIDSSCEKCLKEIKSKVKETISKFGKERKDERFNKN